MKKWLKVLLLCLFIFISIFICVFLFRDNIIRAGFSRLQKNFRQKYNLNLNVGNLSLSGLNLVNIWGLTLLCPGNDTVLQIREAKATLSIINLWRGEILIRDLQVYGASMNINQSGGRSYFRFRNRNQQSNSDALPIDGFSSIATRWYKKLERNRNLTFKLKDILIRYQDSLSNELVRIPAVLFDGEHFGTSLINLNYGDTFVINGSSRKDGQSINLRIEHFGADTNYLPLLSRIIKIRCNFRSLNVKLEIDKGSVTFKLQTEITADKIKLQHWRLAHEVVQLPNLLFKGLFKLEHNSVELDSNSRLILRAVKMHLFARYAVYPDTFLTLGVRMPEVTADSFFESLPGGIFNTLKGISCTGSLAYNFYFAMHTNNPDSLEFYSQLKQKNLSIRHYGKENFSRIAGDFNYDAYDKDRFVRRIEIGPANPDFTPIAQMSPYLAQSVLQAEDPSFMQHRGFLGDAFRESIVQNYKEKRFARGGSTISMQLVKNVFLSRDKTISRKLEEALIVYLIENLSLLSKERMLEVYLNVIEWGPDIYGIGEASRFYFNKRPSQLSLPESLFLASIIPRPKSFRWQFNPDGQLRASLSGYFKILSERMVWRGVLNPEDTVGLVPRLTLKGPAKHVVLPQDSVREEEESE